MLFAGLGLSVYIEKNCALGLEYNPRPMALGPTRDLWHNFSQYGPPGQQITHNKFHLYRHGEKHSSVQLLVSEKKVLMTDVLFSSTNMAVNHLFLVCVHVMRRPCWCTKQ